MTPTEDGVARTARRLLWALPLGTLLVLLGLRLLIDSSVTSRRLSAWAAETLAHRTRSSVQLSGIDFDAFLAPCFEDFEIYRYHGPVRVRVGTPRACVRNWPSAVGSGLRAIHIDLERPSIELRLREGPVGGTSPRGADVRASEAVLREVVLSFDDLELDWKGLPLPARFAEGRFGPIDGRVILQQRGTQRAAVVVLDEPSSGTEVSGRLAPTVDGWDFAAGIEGDVVSMLGQWLDSEHLKLRRMPTRGRIGARWLAQPDRLDLDLDLEQTDVDFESDLVARSRLVGFRARQRAVLSWDLRERALFMKDALLELNGIPIELDLDLVPSDAGLGFGFEAMLRSTPVQRLMRSIPGAVVPELAPELGAHARLGLTARVEGETTAPEGWTVALEPRVVGLEASPTGLEALASPFAYRPLTESGRRADVALTVGPGTRNWVAYDRIPYILRRAILVSEDSNFPFHDGLDVEELKKALADAVHRDKRPRGGSTLTQQLVKNLFLSRDRTALRKGQEALLAFYMEAALSKRELFELYANIIEWGPELYGVGPAAQHYFGRPPSRLEPQEMAYLATIIPAPRRYHAHWKRGSVPLGHRAKVDALLDRLHRLGQLEEEAWTQAKTSRIRFRAD